MSARDVAASWGRSAARARHALRLSAEVLVDWIVAVEMAGTLGSASLAELLQAAFGEGLGLGCACVWVKWRVLWVPELVQMKAGAAVQPSTRVSPWKQEASLPPPPGPVPPCTLRFQVFDLALERCWPWAWRKQPRQDWLH